MVHDRKLLATALMLLGMCAACSRVAQPTVANYYCKETGTGFRAHFSDCANDCSEAYLEVGARKDRVKWGEWDSFFGQSPPAMFTLPWTVTRLYDSGVHWRVNRFFAGAFKADAVTFTNTSGVSGVFRIIYRCRDIAGLQGQR